MSRPGGNWPSAAVRLRSLVDRFALGLLVGLSVLLLLLGKADIKLVGLVGDRLTDGVAPVLEALSRPVLAVRSTFDGIARILAVYEENGRLREESRRLRGWQAEAARLGVENRSLRRMLAVPSVEPSPAWLTGRVVGDSGGVFVEALLVDAGAEQGVPVGMPATTPEGLVGRVITVGRRSARVLLITDFNSKVPVVVASSGDQAILQGDNSAMPLLRFLPLNPAFSLGDLVLTSGRGGMLPPGLVVGRIEAAIEGQIRVRPFVDWARLDFLALLAGAPAPELEADSSASPATVPGT